MENQKEEIQKDCRQENKLQKSNATLTGSSLLIVATILPCLDRILCWFWPDLDVIEDARSVALSINIWQACLYLSSGLIAIAAFFNPNKKLYYYPIVINIYSAIVYFAPVWGFKIKFLQWNSWLAALLSIIIMFPIMRALKHYQYLNLEEKASTDLYYDLIQKLKKLTAENKYLKNKPESQITNEND